MYEAMPTVRTLSDLLAMLRCPVAGSGHHLRWSRGPGTDLSWFPPGGPGMLTAVELPVPTARRNSLPGLRAAISRNPDRRPGTRPWILVGWTCARHPDGSVLVCCRRPVAWVADSLIAEIRTPDPPRTLEVSMVYPYTVSSHHDGVGTIRLAVTGDLDQYVGPDLLTSIADAAGQDSVTDVVVDLAGVTFLAATGVRALLQGRATALRCGCGYRVANPDPLAERVLHLLGLTQVLAVTSAPQSSRAATGD